MKTNTVEQAEKLRELLGDECIDFGLEPSTTEEWMDGPRLTLDDLHLVFANILGGEVFPQLGVIIGRWKQEWIISASPKIPPYITFRKTNNHAQDWTEILIWLIEEGHVGFEVVNKALGDK